MKQEQPYIAELTGLLNAYGKEFVAKLLGVTERGIDNWTSENPKEPQEKNRLKISEYFRKHQKGENLILLSDTADYRDKYIASLEEQVSFLKGQLRHLILVTHAKVETNQNALADLLVKQKIEPAETVEDRLSKENLQNYQKLKSELSIV